MPIVGITGGALTVSTASGGKVTAVNNLGSVAAVQVVAANPQRVKITFHNPGSVDVLIAPVKDANNANIVLASGSRGGGFIVFQNGGQLAIDGECQGAWQAIALSGANNPLTIMESNVP